MSAFLTATLVAVLALATGCSVYDPELVQGIQPGFCGFRPPQRPPDAGEPVEFEVVYALKDVTFESGERVGFDLDGVCTDLPDLVGSCTPAGTFEAAEDGDRGRDNVFGDDVIPTVESDVPDLQDTARAAQNEGVGAILVRIRNYNGTPSDDNVQVTLAVSVAGTTEAAFGDVLFDSDPPFAPALSDGSPPPPPSWSGGTDHFWARADNFTLGDPDRPIVRDVDAYVANNMLVVRIPDNASFVFPGDGTGIEAKLTGGLLVGRFSDDLTQLQDTRIAGRWSVSDLIETASKIGVCPGPRRDILIALLDNVADVRGDGRDEMGLECDAISVTIKFQGFQARWPTAAVQEGPELVDACAPMP